MSYERFPKSVPVVAQDVGVPMPNSGGPFWDMSCPDECVDELLADIAVALPQVRSHKNLLLRCREAITRLSVRPIRPLYYVQHPDGSYSVADPQPRD